MSAVGKFTQSGPFRALLNEFVVEEQDDTLGPVGSTRLQLVHNTCVEAVCDIEDGDDMALLVETVIQHDCPADEEG